MRWSTAFFGLVCCVALAQETGPAQKAAQTFIPSTGHTYYLDLDAPEGSYSQWRLDDLKGLCALQASVRIPRLRKHSRYISAFNIWVEDSALSGKTKRVGLQIYSRISHPPLDILIMHYDGPDLVVTENSHTRLGLDAAVPVEIVWLPLDSVIIKIGENEVHRLKVPWKIERIMITASTGQMKVDPLILGCFDQAPTR